MSPDSDGCGYRLEVGLSGRDLSTHTCNRPTWEDHDRCIWHAQVEGKTAEELSSVPLGDEEDLDGAYLRNAQLVGTDWFAGRSMVGADFTNATINGTDFSESDLTLATLRGVSGINTDFSDAILEGAIFTEADLRRARIKDALLHEAVFTNVHIGSETHLGSLSIYEREGIKPRLSDDHPLEAASWAYRQLQQVYRTNALPGAARDCYTREKNARRKLAWNQGRYREALIRELSRWVALYGSSPYRLLLTSLVVVTVFALLFPLTGGIQESQGQRVITYSIDDPVDAPNWWLFRVMFKSFYFSLVTFATLGYGDIQPIGETARLLAGIETILGTLLSALLVFVLARIVTW